jgi:hypothetical protein
MSEKQDSQYGFKHLYLSFESIQVIGVKKIHTASVQRRLRGVLMGECNGVLRLLKESLTEMQRGGYS